jgi:predicted  nucleic acid-binding Zn-ribbon protein
VTPEVAALLEVQSEDLRTYGIEDKLSALVPRLNALELDRKKASEALTSAKAQVDAEEQRQREIQDRLRQHREMRDKSENLLGQLTTPREAAACMAQIEQAKRFIADEESDLEGIQNRLKELRSASGEREQALKDVERVQEETRSSLAIDKTALEKELKEVKTVRDSKAAKVPRSLMQRYDRIRAKRRSTALYPLRGESCANCDTAIPMQRRSSMVATGATELCEGCGVLLYVPEQK